MSGLKGFPNVLLCLTCSVTSVSSRLTRCSVSGSRICCRSVRSMPRSMVSKARDMSKRRRWTVRSSAHTACSISTLNVKTNSVVLLPGLYAACVILISCLITLKVLSITIMASIFLSIDRSIIGLRFLTGPLGLPGLGSGTKSPRLISVGLCPVSAV